MKRFSLAVLLSLTFAASSFGQLIKVEDVSATKYQAKTTITRIFSEDGRIIKEWESKGVETEVGKTVGKTVSLAETAEGYGPPTVEFEHLLTGQDASKAFKKEGDVWVCWTPGKYRARVIAVNKATFAIKSEKYDIQVVAPTPPARNDYNVGVISAQTSEVEDRKKIAAAYREAAGFLYGFPSYKYVRSTQNNKTDTNVIIWLRNKLSNEKYFLDVMESQLYNEQRRRGAFTVKDWNAAFLEIADALDPQPKATKTSKPVVLRSAN